jgi:hypothetical protein
LPKILTHNCFINEMWSLNSRSRFATPFFVSLCCGPRHEPADSPSLRSARGTDGAEAAGCGASGFRAVPPVFWGGWGGVAQFHQMSHKSFLETTIILAQFIAVIRSGPLPLLIESVTQPSDVRMALALSTVANRNRGVLRHTDILWMRTTVGRRSGSRPLLDGVWW